MTKFIFGNNFLWFNKQDIKDFIATIKCFIGKGPRPGYGRWTYCVINFSQIVHSDEALLAVGFIFTIHFFNTHFRPEAFPMDTVIFTGHIPLELFKHERPREYQELVDSGKLEESIVEKHYSKDNMRLIRTFGFLALGIGVILIALIIYTFITGGGH